VELELLKGFSVVFVVTCPGWITGTDHFKVGVEYDMLLEVRSVRCSI